MELKKCTCNSFLDIETDVIQKLPPNYNVPYINRLQDDVWRRLIIKTLISNTHMDATYSKYIQWTMSEDCNRNDNEKLYNILLHHGSR